MFLCKHTTQQPIGYFKSARLLLRFLVPEGLRPTQGGLRSSVMKYRVTKKNYYMVLHRIAWYGMVLYGIAWYCMVLHGIAWHCIVLHGIAWYCMVLQGIALHCMVLHDIA